MRTCERLILEIGTTPTMNVLQSFRRSRENENFSRLVKEMKKYQTWGKKTFEDWSNHDPITSTGSVK